jgi:hypothetical protein
VDDDDMNEDVGVEDDDAAQVGYEASSYGHDDGDPTWDQEPSRRTLTRRRPLPSQWLIASSTSSLCGTASPSNFVSPR